MHQIQVCNRLNLQQEQIDRLKSQYTIYTERNEVLEAENQRLQLELTESNAAVSSVLRRVHQLEDELALLKEQGK